MPYAGGRPMRLTDEQIREEYRKLPFVTRISKMGVSLRRVRRIAREMENERRRL